MGRAALAAVSHLALVAFVAGCRSGGGATPAEPAPATDAAGSVAPTAPAADSVTAAAPTSGGGPPNALGMPGASIAAVVNPMNLPPYAGPTGTVEGTVVVRGPDSPDVADLDVRACPAALDTYGKLFRAGARRADGSRPLADALVIITGYQGFYLPAKSEAERVIIGASCAYPTRTIALTFGQRLEVANDSSIAFAPYIEGGSQLSVMIAAPQRRGEPVKIFPPRADFFPLRDQLQKFVRGELYVLRQPLHAVTDTRGQFRLEGVPVGRLKIAARLGALLDEAVADVEVRADAVQTVELALRYAPRDAGTAPRAGGR